MEDQQNPVVPEVKKDPKNNIKVLLGVGIAVSLVIGFFGGWYVGNSAVSKTSGPIAVVTPIPKVVNTDPRQMLDPIETLKSPVFTEWNGSVKGVVASKGADSFVIEKNGRQLTVYLQHSLTGFFKENANVALAPTKIEFSDVKVGDTVSGGVTITRGSLENNSNEHIYANVFTVLNEKPSSQ